MKYLLILLLICSCASAKKKAIELSENGKHEEAIAHWVDALKADPDDDEIKNGLEASLGVVSNDRLTKVRDLRLSNQNQKAIQELKGLVDLQKKFNIKMDFNSSTFQGKEVQYLWPHYQETILVKIKNSMPLSAEADQKDYRDVFSSMAGWNQLQKQVNQKGLVKCDDLRKYGTNKPFYRSFVSQFCKYWGPERSLSSDSNISSVLFSKVETTSTITNIDGTSAGSLRAALNKTFADSPWYNPEANKLVQVKLSGTYNWTPKSENVRQVHNYKVSVPYTAYENVKRSRQTPYSTTEKGVMVTKYRTEYYKVKEPVTRYRDEARIYEYQALRKSLTLDLNISGNITIDHKSYPFSFMKNDKEEKYLHALSIPSIGLHPKNEDVSSPMVKFETYSQLAAEKFRLDINNIWKKLYCTLPSERDIASVGENTLRCHRLAQYPEVFVNNWFNNHFGVSAIKAKELIGQF